MKLIIYVLILYIETIISYSIVVLPFELNKINFSKKKYSSTELINLLYKVELYTPIQLGSENQKYFGIISLNDHHPMLSESNCKKMKLFQKNGNIIKKGYRTSNSKSCKFLGNYTDYLNQIKFVEFYSEEFSYYNTSILEQITDNNVEKGEIILVKDNTTTTDNPEMCLSIGLNEFYRVYSTFVPPHFVDDLHNKRITRTEHWTIKFTDQNSGLLIIGDLPENYENDTKRYSIDNFAHSYTKQMTTFFRPWGIKMKDIYFYNNTKTNETIIVNHDENKFTIVHDYGFIIGSNNYKELIYNNYFENLIIKKICVLEKSEQTIYNYSFDYIDSDGSFSMFICDKKKMKNYIKKFPTLYFSNVDYDYVFEMSYQDLFFNINNYYYFMIIFPNNQTGKGIDENWFIGLPFLKQYQFVFNFDSKSIDLYKFKNFDYNKKDDDDNDEDDSIFSKKFWLICLQIFLIIILIIISIVIGMYLNRQRKKRANELKDDDYEYMVENETKGKKDFIN